MNLRRACWVLVPCVLFVGGCKKESPPAPEAVERRGVTEALGQMEAAAAGFAKTLTDEKVKGVLTYEQQMLQHAPVLAGRGADGGALDREARRSELSRVTREALEKGGVTQSDVTNFTTLTAELFAGEVAVAHARRELAANPAKVERWKALEAEASKFPEPERSAFLQQHLEAQPLTDFMVEAYQRQLAEQEALRAQFAERHGEQTLAVIDRYKDDFVALRQRQLDAVLGEK